MGFWKNLFSRVDPLITVGKSGDAEAFAALFLQREMTFLVLSGELDSSGNKVGPAAEPDPDVVRPFIHEEDSGRRVFPIFTGEDSAATFAGAYASLVGKVVIFSSRKGAGGDVARLFPPKTEVALNWQSDSDYFLSERDLRSLRARES